MSSAHGPDLLPPSLARRFRAEELLGKGGFGRVVLARDREVGRRVAVKLLASASPSPAARARFEREARLTARLGHPGIVPVYEAGHTEEGVCFIVYEYVAGLTLAEAADTCEPGILVAAAAQVAEALEVVHQAGVVHRDVKPENVLLREDATAVLCDFGIARVEGGETVVTAEGLLLGTPAYMAPELWRGHAPSSASDQFALGASLQRMLVGELPYGSGEPAVILEEIATGWSWEPPPGLPAALLPVLARSLASDPAERYPACAALATALRRVARPSAAVPVGPAETSRSNPAVESSPRLEPLTTDGGTSSGSPVGLPRAPLLVGVLALGLVAGVRVMAPGPRTSPGPPAIASASALAPSLQESVPDLATPRRALEDAVVRFRERLERVVPGLGGLTAGAQVRSFLPATLSEDLPAVWRELLEALAAWIAARTHANAPPWEDPEELAWTLATLRLSNDFLHHLWELDGLAQRPLDLRGTFAPGERPRSRARVALLREEAEDTLGALLTGQHDLPAWLRAEVCAGVLLAGHADLELVLGEALLGLEQASRDEAWVAALRDLVTVFRRFRSRGGLPCEVRAGTWERILAMDALPAARAAWGAPILRARLLVDCLSTWCEVIQNCGDATPERTEAAFLAALRTVEQILRAPDHDPRHGEAGIVRRDLRSLLDLRGAVPGQEAFFAEVAELEELVTRLAEATLEP
jgi:serine/threonine protein kinase